MAHESVLVEDNGTVRTVTINNPTRMNAVTNETVHALIEAVADAPADTRAIVLRGAGAAFCTGLDLKSIDLDSGEIDGSMIDDLNTFTRALTQSPAIVIGALSGPAVGVGAAFALATDIIVAVETAYVQVSFGNIGLMPDGGGTALLAAAVGRPRALAMALSGAPLRAADALKLGVFTQVVPEEQFDAAVAAVAGAVVSGSAPALAYTKLAINGATLGLSLEDAFGREKPGQLDLLTSQDFKLGVEAFRAKQRPAFVEPGRSAPWE